MHRVKMKNKSQSFIVILHLDKIDNKHMLYSQFKDAKHHTFTLIGKNNDLLSNQIFPSGFAGGKYCPYMSAS